MSYLVTSMLLKTQQNLVIRAMKSDRNFQYRFLLLNRWEIHPQAPSSVTVKGTCLWKCGRHWWLHHQPPLYSCLCQQQPT